MSEIDPSDPVFPHVRGTQQRSSVHMPPSHVRDPSRSGK